MAAEQGYIQVQGPQTDVWLRCDRCSTSDAFLLETSGVRCAECDATYGFAVHQGVRYELDALKWVSLRDGPAALGSYEIAWDRIFGLAVVVIGSGLLYWVWTTG